MAKKRKTIEGISEKITTEQNKVLQSVVNAVPFEDFKLLDEGYKTELATNPKYSLQVDPMGVYNFDEVQKRFIKAWLQFMNFAAVATYLGMEIEDVKMMYEDFAIQQEIRRIRMSMYMRQFNTRMLTVDEIGGYLTSVLVDDLPLSERLTTKDKLQAAKMLIDLNELKKSAYDNPNIIEYADFEADLQDLSAKSIKQLIDNSMKPTESKEKNELINDMNKDNSFFPEDYAYLKTLSHKELLELQEKMNGVEKKDAEK